MGKPVVATAQCSVCDYETYVFETTPEQVPCPECQNSAAENVEYADMDIAEFFGLDVLAEQNMRDAGYNTLGDVGDTSAYLLSKVPGIENDEATRMKKEARSVLDDNIGHLRITQWGGYDDDDV